MGINIGGSSHGGGFQDLGPAFKKTHKRVSSTKGFGYPAPYNQLNGHWEPLDPDSVGFRVALLTVTDEQHDYLVCEGFDPNKGKNVSGLHVAKPYHLQKTPFHGQTITVGGQELTYDYTGMGERTVTSGAEEEDQQITPNYFDDEVLVCVRAKVRGSDSTGDEDADGKKIRWVDLNSAGRAWATEAPACE